MNFLIHKPSEFIPEVTDTVLLMDRVRSAFMKPFEAEKNVSRKIHNAFKNRYFMVFSSLGEASRFCQEKLAPLIAKPRELSPRIELRGVVEDQESGTAFCVINIIFPNPNLVEEAVAALEQEFFPQ